MSAPPPSTRSTGFAPPQPPQLSGPPPSPVPAGFPWWLPFAALLVAYGITIVLTVILAGIAGVRAGQDLPSAITLAGTFIQDVLLVTVAVLLARSAGLRVSPGAFGLRRVSPWMLGLAVLTFVVFYGLLVGWSQLLDPTAQDDAAEQLGARDSTAALIAVAILVTVVAPIVEEIFFRGVMFGALGRALGWLPGALITGAVFGLIHAGGTDAIFIVPLGMFGFVLCVLYRRTASLLPGMGVHALNNALALGVTLGWTPGQIALIVIIAPVVVVALVSSVAE